MRRNQLFLLFAAVIVLVTAARAATPPRNHARHRRETKASRAGARQPDCGSPFDYQVLLDRAGFSPGQIDDSIGRNTQVALRAFQQANNLEPTGQPSCDTWQALRQRDGSDTAVAYTVTPKDLAGPFIPSIPDDLVKQAQLPALAYRSPLEELGERFHVSPRLLGKQMNPGVVLQPGVTIRVPNVPQDVPTVASQDGSVTSQSFRIEVSREDSSLVLRDVEGQVVFVAPATVGSQHDPLPVGDWKVKGVAWHPVFHYNPKLFWDANPQDSKATVPAGPNNPVGAVWIAIADLPHYGIHGTPDPGLVGHSYSHGCIRLTNWDAEQVARAVRPGTPVHFK